jgi:hypothetical protein
MKAIIITSATIIVFLDPIFSQTIQLMISPSISPHKTPFAKPAFHGAGRRREGLESPEARTPYFSFNLGARRRKRRASRRSLYYHSAEEKDGPEDSFGVEFDGLLEGHVAFPLGSIFGFRREMRKVFGALETLRMSLSSGWRVLPNWACSTFQRGNLDAWWR